MPLAAYTQNAFLGGEWGPLSQGRADLPAYKTALSTVLNAVVAEEGAWLRRSGFQYLCKTRSGNYAKLLPLATSQNENAYVMEFTDGYVRFFNGTSICFTTVHSLLTASSFSSGTLTLTVVSGTGFAVGDDIMLWSPPTLDPAKIQAFRGRVMRLTAVSGTTLTAKDETGTAFSGLSSTTGDLVGCVVYQVAHKTTSWTGQDVLAALRVVQVPQVSTGSYSLVLSQTVVPTGIIVSSAQVVTLTAAINDPIVGFSDGPYLDPQGIIVDLPAETGTVNAYSGSITFTPASTTFVAADVGRCIRLYQQPAAWASGTGYTYGQVVTYDSKFWVSIGTGTYATNTGTIPGTTIGGVTVWAPAPNQAVWAWGVITAQATTTCTVSLKTNLVTANGSTITTWRLGLYMAGQYPTCGTYWGGRLWLGGAVPNRWDAGMAGENPLHFSPTAANGQVDDNHAISFPFAADDNNTVLWMSPDQQGVMMGTASGEWLVHSGNESPITPTNIRADRVTRFGAADMEAQRAGMCLIFVQRYQRRVMEHLVENQSARYSARHLNEFAKHLATEGVEEIVYQEETVPVLWARMADGSLAGCTYRRASRFITEQPLEAWHKHIVGGNYSSDIVRPITSICGMPAPQGLNDYLYAVTSDVNDADYFVQLLRPMFEEG